MPRLTLRTLLAYIDDTLEPAQARSLGRKVAESEEAKQLIERIKKVTRRRGLKAPVPDGSDDDVSDPNMVAEYLSDNLDSDQLKQLESTCLESDVHLAEVAACHQILTLVLTEPVRVPPTANQRMYQLVPAPGSDPNRKPGKTIPIGGVPRSDQPEGDDPDAALLLGMKRYGAADSRAGRLKLVAAVAAISLLLILAVAMALPHRESAPLISARGPAVSYASAPSAPTRTETAPEPGLAPTPRTKTSEAKSKTSDPKAEIAPKKEGADDKKEPEKVAPKDDKKEPKAGGPGLGENKVPPPLPDRVVVGAMEQPNVIVLSRSLDPGSKWLRVDPDNPKVTSSDAVMALPGYKADVKLESGLVVQLWGNIPDQVPDVIFMKPIMLQSRVRFHKPPPGLDADLTLEEGRIYLRPAKAAGAKVRVRIASDNKWNNIASAVWDLDIPDKALVLIEAHLAFVPGTPYPKEGVGGEPPRLEAIMAVDRGAISFEDKARYAKFSVAADKQVSWDSKTDKLVPPADVNKRELIPDQFPEIPGELGKVIQRVLSEAALGLKDRDGVRSLLEARMSKPLTERGGPDVDLTRVIAVYSYAAVADGADDAEARKMIGNLYDVMKDTDYVPVRQSGITAMGLWLARAPGNTPLFVGVVVSDKNVPPEDANLMAQLVRGYSAATFGPAAWNPNRVDELLRFLDNQYIVIREAALGNLVYYYDLPAVTSGALKPPSNSLFLNVGVGLRDPRYDQFLKDWQLRGEELKKWMEARPMGKGKK